MEVMEAIDISKSITNDNATIVGGVSKQNNSNISFNSIDYLTLEIMANTDSYNKYLKKNNLDHDTVLKKEKRFYRKRIISMTKDILFNNSSGQDDLILNAFNTYARICISYFKFKDTMDTIQSEYTNITNTNEGVCESICDSPDNNADADISEANKLFMRQMEKKVLTLDNFVIKTAPPPDEMVVPQTKDFNLKDPKYKKKDIKKFSKQKSSLNHLAPDGVNVIISKKEKSEIELSLDQVALVD